MLLDIKTYWGIHGEPVATTPTTWDVVGKYILKLVKTEDNAQSNVRLSAALRADGVPVSHILPLKDGGDYMVTQEGCYLLMEKLGGSHVREVFQQNYAEIAYQTGFIIAKIHCALAKITDKQTVNQSFDEELRGWIRNGLTKSSLLTQEEWSKPIESLCSIYPSLPKQQIHRDLHYGNLLFEGTTLTGVLDFDLGKQDARLFDIAYFLLGQLLGQKDLMAIKDKWLTFISQFLLGYESITVLEEVEKESLLLMMQCIELLFVVFWEKQANQEETEATIKIFKFIERIIEL
ncbi:phosphotransferase enzyme family protein [Lacrimispora sp.]|uniref:phosphotransferase enzyme family protein n=1 Tax=Lacrimispora sp. TaxID=2719234 RepID=UPI0028A812AD|nr:phosphotransferase [Lacrimispora sp.]